jgi:hypothetical protein
MDNFIVFPVIFFFGHSVPSKATFFGIQDQKFVLQTFPQPSPTHYIAKSVDLHQNVEQIW